MRQYLPDGAVMDEARVVPYVAIDERTAQTVALGTTTIHTTAAGAARMYHVSIYLVVTTAGTAGTITASVHYTDLTGAQVTTSAAASASVLQSKAQLDQVIRSEASTAIQLSTTFTGVTGSPAYAVFTVIERMQ